VDVLGMSRPSRHPLSPEVQVPHPILVTPQMLNYPQTIKTCLRRLKPLFVQMWPFLRRLEHLSVQTKVCVHVDNFPVQVLHADATVP
jgi:hypothetical protein